MKRILNERNVVSALFVLVIITFAFAERDTEKLEELYTPITAKSFYKAPVERAEVKMEVTVAFRPH